MNRCTLCGGKLTLNGKCTECGLDNSKNDKQYRLNQHSEKGMRLHHGDCEENLNKKRETYGKSSVRSQSAQTVQMVRKEKKKSQERQQTGTVKKKKKGSCLGWLVLIFALFGGFAENADDIFYEIETFFERVFSEPIQMKEPEEVYVETAAQETAVASESKWIAPVAWNEGVEQYYTTSLGAGIYTGGYDIPAGVYQLDCTEGSTYVYWWNPDASEGGSAILLSEAEQSAYEAMEEEETYSRYSEMFELEEGGILYVEIQAGLTLSGYRNSPLSLKERAPQGLKEEVLLDGAVQSDLVVGEQFEAGTYDVIAEGGYGVFMNIDRNGSYYYISLGDGETFLRFPFSEGAKIELEFFGEDASVRLVPSY